MKQRITLAVFAIIAVAVFAFSNFVTKSTGGPELTGVFSSGVDQGSSGSGQGSGSGNGGGSGGGGEVSPDEVPPPAPTGNIYITNDGYDPTIYDGTVGVEITIANTSDRVCTLRSGPEGQNPPLLPYNNQEIPSGTSFSWSPDRDGTFYYGCEERDGNFDGGQLNIAPAPAGN